ncbi:ENTH domain-containing protein [Saitozyma sp. JCM 24511]|nr:ENTH domain-containing protein [Saitozyma sp. JCM 24511]
MDYIENLAKQASQITMYDLKSYYNQAKNAVLNVSEMEAKVREATNDEPWGASSTLMQQIADGTHNYQLFNEIMPTIYARFMEKEAREWRQIYKALTLLEFLVKNGSERVVDDARAHVSTIKMLRSFHYIDEKGKDQGINVRNRASEIAALLGDVEKIRTERRKAKANKNKYQGQGNDGGMSFVTATGSRYGGFGSETIGAGGGGGGSGGYGGDEYRSRNFRDTSSAAEYDEYEGADDFDEAPRRTTSASTSRSGGGASSSRPQPPPKSAAPKEKPVEKPKEVNLFDFGDEDEAPAPAPAPSFAAPAAPILGGDGMSPWPSRPLAMWGTAGAKIKLTLLRSDDFDDFQTAPSSAAAAPAPVAAPAGRPSNAGLFDLLNNPSKGLSGPPLSGPPLSGPPLSNPVLGSRPSMTPSAPSYTSTTSVTSPGAAPAPGQAQAKPTSGSTFDDLWTTSLSTMGKNGSAPKPTPKAGTGGKTIRDLEQEQTMSKLWGPTTTTTTNANVNANASASANGAAQKPAGGGFDDLLL